MQVGSVFTQLQELAQQLGTLTLYHYRLRRFCYGTAESRMLGSTAHNRNLYIQFSTTFNALLIDIDKRWFSLR